MFPTRITSMDFGLFSHKPVTGRVNVHFTMHHPSMENGFIPLRKSDNDRVYGLYTHLP